MQKFEAIIDELEEFHKTEAYNHSFIFLGCREQLKEIQDLSQKNREVTSKLISSMRELSSFTSSCQI